MDRQRTETTAARLSQVLLDQRHELRIIGSFQPLQQVAEAIGRDRGLHEPVQRRVLEAIEILKVLPGVLQQPVASQQTGIEFHGQVRPSIHRLTLVIELQIQRALQKIERLLGVLRVREQHLAVLNLQHARRVVVTLNPRLQEWLDAVELLETLKIQTVVVVVILGARNELFEGLAAVFRQRVSPRDTRSLHPGAPPPNTTKRPTEPEPCIVMTVFPSASPYGSFRSAVWIQNILAQPRAASGWLVYLGNRTLRIPAW